MNHTRVYKWVNADTADKKILESQCWRRIPASFSWAKFHEYLEMYEDCEGTHYATTALLQPTLGSGPVIS